MNFLSMHDLLQIRVRMSIAAAQGKSTNNHFIEPGLVFELRHAGHAQTDSLSFRQCVARGYGYLSSSLDCETKKEYVNNLVVKLRLHRRIIGTRKERIGRLTRHAGGASIRYE